MNIAIVNIAQSAIIGNTKTSIRDIIGVTHCAGRYNHTDDDFLNEGADILLDMGVRVIKLWFTSNPQKAYSYNSQWPKVSTLIEEAETPYFQKLFDKPFSTIMLVTYPPDEDWNALSKGLSATDKSEVQRRIYEFTKYLLTRYKDSGKTFVLQNWESDWALTDPQFSKEPDPIVIQSLIDWLNARQAGVDQARKEIGIHGVRVVHAAEVNLVKRAMNGKTTATNNVLPHTRCDLYSYSAWDTVTDPAEFKLALDYLALKAPDSKLYGNRNIYIGEVGAAENGVGGGKKQLEYVKPVIETAIEWGSQYVIYWQLYCDGQLNKADGRPSNADCSGLWLIRPDGTKSPVWYYLQKMIKRYSY
ncbi:MAG: hypothetical protein ACYC27_02480 [Armatimonadota bacterium]